MSDTEPKQESRALAMPQMRSGGAVSAIVPQTFEDTFRLARAVVMAGMAPKTLNTPEKALVAIMHGMEVGLAPMTALQSIAVINGNPSIWGDGALGLVRGSGLVESFREWIEGEGDARTAYCEGKRISEPDMILNKFSIADAKKAKLWGKQGPWTDYPDRMQKMRARSWTLRDGWADVLRGLRIREEVEDYGTALDVTPPSTGLRERLESRQKATEGFTIVTAPEASDELPIHDAQTGEVLNADKVDTPLTIETLDEYEAALEAATTAKAVTDAHRAFRASKVWGDSEAEGHRMWTIMANERLHALADEGVKIPAETKDPDIFRIWVANKTQAQIKTTFGALLNAKAFTDLPASEQEELLMLAGESA